MLRPYLRLYLRHYFSFFLLLDNNKRVTLSYFVIADVQIANENSKMQQNTQVKNMCVCIALMRVGGADLYGFCYI